MCNKKERMTKSVFARLRRRKSKFAIKKHEQKKKKEVLERLRGSVQQVPKEVRR
jgi:hypothetical protein